MKSLTTEKIKSLSKEAYQTLGNEVVNFYYKNTPPSKTPQEYLDHFHEKYEIIFILNGKIRYTAEGREFHLNKHDVVFTRPKTYHHIETYADCSYERICLLLSPLEKFEKLAHKISQDFMVFNCMNNSIILQIFSKLRYYIDTFENETALALIENMCEELLCNFTLFKPQDLLLPNNSSSLIQNAIEYIKRNLSTIKNLDEVAQALFVSKSYLFKSFKTALKISPKRYILTLRLHLAHSLIVAGEKASSVSIKCGFINYNSFYKSFVHYYGYAPSYKGRISLNK